MKKTLLLMCVGLFVQAVYAMEHFPGAQTPSSPRVVPPPSPIFFGQGGPGMSVWDLTQIAQEAARQARLRKMDAMATGLPDQQLPLSDNARSNAAEQLGQS